MNLNVKRRDLLRYALCRPRAQGQARPRLRPAASIAGMNVILCLDEPATREVSRG